MRPWFTALVPALVLAGACGDERSQAPTGDDAEAWIAADVVTAPPPPITLAVTDLRPGVPATLATTGAAPGSTVVFAFSPTQGSGPCPPPLDGLCLDLVDPTQVGSAVADAYGVARLDFVVPSGAPVAALANFQSGEIGPVAAVSPVVSKVVLDPTMSDFSLVDENETSPTWDLEVSPRDYLVKVSGWYFGHAT